MNLKHQLEMVRGEPIQVFDGDPMDIPCIETSDAEKLCKNPVVSVHMITYNHEPYIRQAIDGVMMQRTNFEFELVIGEDCSQDKTREICFEYQRKYPDKIRVLWWHENVSKLGGNDLRNFARCRGQFIAYCEGDDYWIDPLKLQKQVDLIRKTGAVMCVADSEWHYPDGTVTKFVYHKNKTLLEVEDIVETYFHTTTYLFRRDVYKECRKRFREIILWYDTESLTCMAAMGPICYLPEIVSVYNRTGKGISGDVNSIAFNKLQATHLLQFTYCSDNIISSCHYEKLIRFLRRMYLSRSGNGYRYPVAGRRRILRVLINAIRHKEGCLKAFYMFMKMHLYYSLKSRLSRKKYQAS